MPIPAWEDIERDPRFGTLDPATKAKMRAAYDTVAAQQYDTRLAPDEEQKFQAWKQQYAPNDSGADYDLRGAYRAGLTPDAATGHWPDTFKKPNHPTFSVESKYAADAPDKAGRWEGDQYVAPASLTRRLLAGGLRIVPPILGAVGGAALGGPAGGYAGAAAGGAGGEYLAEKVLGEPADLKEIGLQGVMSALPAGEFAGVTSTLGRAGVRAAEGAAMGGGQDVARRWLHGEEQQPAETAQAALRGGVLGGAAGALEARLRRGIPAPAAEPTPAPEVAPAATDIPGIDVPEAPAADIGLPPQTKTVPKGLPKFEPSAPSGGATGELPPEAPTSARGYFVRVPGEAPIPAARPRDEERTAAQLENISSTWAHLPQEDQDRLKQIVLDNPEAISAATRGTQPKERTIAIARELRPDLDKRMPAGTMLNDTQTVTMGQTVGGLLQQARTLGQQITAGDRSPDLLARFQKAQADAANAVISYTGRRAEAGRALGAGRYVTESMLPMSRFFKRGIQLGVPPQKLAEMMTLIPENDVEGQMRFLTAARTITNGDLLKAFWYNNILSGPKTHERNIIGNTFNALWRPLSTPAAALAERLSGAAPEQRQVFAGEVPHQVYGAFAGMQKGVENALYLFKHGYSPTQLRDLEVRPPEIPGGVYTNFIGRALGAADEFFNTILQNMEMQGGAYAMARREAAAQHVAPEKLKDFLTDRIADLTTNPLAKGAPDLYAQAEKFAERGTYHEAMGERSENLARWIRSLGPVGWLLMPFVKTPANIFRQGVQASPIGFATKLGQEAGRMGAQARGEAALGSALLLPVAWLAATGKISGAGPKDPAKLDQLRASGWQPNSILIGGKWIPYSNIQPLAVPFSMIANVGDALRYGELNQPVDKVIGAVVGKVANSALQQSYLQGLFNFVQAVNDPDRFGAAFIRSYATSAIPFSGAARTVRQIEDPTIRSPTNTAEAVEANLPMHVGEALGLPRAQPKVRATGEIVTREPGEFGIPAAVAPFGRTTEKTDAVRDEVHRLADSGLMKELNVPAQKPSLTLGRQAATLTPESGTALRQAQGTATRAALTRVMQSGVYPRMSDPQRADALKKAIREGRQVVLDRAKQLTARRQTLTTETLIPPGMQRYLGGQ